MIIEYLKFIEEEPLKRHDDPSSAVRGIPLAEIQTLETAYGAGNPLPKVLKELLFLAGEYPWFFDSGARAEDQESARYMLANSRLFDGTPIVLNITRPWFLITKGPGMEELFFIYLDEGLDNPMVYNANLSDHHEGPDIERIENTEINLLDTIKGAYLGYRGY